MDFLSLLGRFADAFQKWVVSALSAIHKFLTGLTASLQGVFKTISDFFEGVWKHVRGIWKSLQGLKTSHLWATINKWYNRYAQWRDWYNKHILGPIQQIQNMINNLYNVIFGPIIKTIDSVRVMLDSLLFFHRAWAQKIDAELFGLEAKVLTPITYMLARVNALSSLSRAVLTNAGRFDGQIFMDTLIFHVKDIFKTWNALWKQARTPATGPLPRTTKQTHDDLLVFLRTGKGPLQPGIDLQRQIFLQTLKDLE